MEQKNFIHKIKLLIILAFAMLIGQNTLADNVVGYNLTVDDASTIGSAANHPGGIFSVSASLSTPDFSSGYASSKGWDTADQYWTISPFSTIGLHTITVGAMMNSDDDGPRDFQLQYKLSGGSWTNTGLPISLTGTQVTYNRTLPEECSNVTDLSVRWINTSGVSFVDGAILPEAMSYIQNISILGSLPTRPNTQTSGITFTSITPTTITIDGVIGNGDHRIIYVVKNTTGDVAPAFPDPADDAIFTANPDYQTGAPTGYQVVYNGTGSNVTITVPSSTNEYWFRVYDYNLNGTMPRYYLPTNTNNPNLCSLPTIVTDPATLIRLTTATIGATISASHTPVTARGTQWKINSSLGTSTTQGKLAEGGTGIGSFIRNLTGQTRGSKFYYRGYATNTSGTIYSNELYYENIPIFTGEGTWEDNTKWNVLQVPGSTGTGGFGNVLDKPFIDGTCTLNATNSVTTVTVNATRTLNIAPDALLTTTTLTNNGGTAGIVIQANSSGANGSLKWTNPVGNSQVGTVEMWSKAYTDISSYPTKNRWQYFGIPVTSLTLGNTFSNANERVRKYNEASGAGADAVGLWVPTDATHTNTPRLDNSTIMVPVDGYEVVQPAAKKYSFAGTLNHIAVNKSLTYTAGEYSGSHILANPFTSAINVSAITYTGAVENAVYIYNTGNLQDWTNNTASTTPGSNPGTYSVSTGGFAGIFGVPAQIPSMQGFLVKATGEGSSIGIPLSALTANINPQRAPLTEGLEKVATMIDIIGAHSSDRMWIFSEESCTPKFDNGFDGPKISGSALNTQLYAIGEDGDYQINAVSDINNSYLGFQAGQDRTFKLVITHQNLTSKYSGVYLVDLVANKTIDITASGTEYSFSSEATPTAVNRFKIVTQTTALKNTTNNQLTIVSNLGSIIISNPTNETGSLVIYNLSGNAIQTTRFEANETVTIPMNLVKGVYVAKATTPTEEVKEKLIIR